MWIHRDGPVVRVRTPAKVNLFLEVLGRRPDGYHDLATLMVTVGLCDTLEFREGGSSEVRLGCDQPGLPTGPDNLVCRAAELLRDRFGVRAGVDVRLTKRIPIAAGLAGGSSDAAATLAGLNRLWRLGLGANQLSALGAELGSDVSFFFFGPAAWCTGRGEVVEPLKLGGPIDLVLVCPEAGLSTASVFKALELPGAPVDGAGVRRAVESGDVEELGRCLFNRLEEPAMRLCPEVGRWRERLARLGPAGARMSGSGSTVFALARGAADALRLSRALSSVREDGARARVHVVRSCD
jgi:4-diphosphocytidyl-2-C-methyl-D-erythritol kinase